MAGIPLHVLLLEDVPEDAELTLHQLRRSGFEPEAERVDDEAGFKSKLVLNQRFDLILADYHQPQFDAGRALRILCAAGLDIPFVIVSGAIGEDVAVQLIRDGAADYVLKDRLGRLGTAVQNALEQARLRRGIRRTEQFTRLISIVAEAANQASTGDEAMQVSLDEICLTASLEAGHAWIVPRDRSAGLDSTRLWHVSDPERIAGFREFTENASLRRGSGLVGRVLETHQTVTIDDLAADTAFQRSSVAAAAGLTSAIAVPVLVGTNVVAVLEFYGNRPLSTDTELIHVLEHVALLLGRVVERSRAREALQRQATTDSLTALPNRTLLRERLEQAVRVGNETGQGVALLLADLDNFKEINDTFGHHIGDGILRQMGPRFRQQLRESDTVARLGGDEFGVLIPGAGATDAVRIANHLLMALKEPVRVEGHPLEVAASIGIAVHPDHGSDASTLLQRADVAMYLAKRSGNTYAIYSSADDPYDATRLVLIADLRAAVDARQITPYYQPKVGLRTNRLTGLEALARWKHPQRGWISPAEFIPLVERMGLIKPLTTAMLDQVLRDCKRWQDEGIAVPVAINLSMRNLLDPEFPEFVAGKLAASGVRPGLLRFEITESAVMSEPARAAGNMTALRDLGLGFAIDDFGTGYSSLAYLQRLPVDEIKIDRSFVKQMATESGSAAIVRATVDLGTSLGLEVVAEGVEDLTTWNLLAACLCQTAQGFLMSRAVPTREIEAWLRQPIWTPLPSAA